MQHAFRDAAVQLGLRRLEVAVSTFLTEVRMRERRV
jgi:hypothetical protein